MNSGAKPLIFISYSHKDRAVIALLREQLEVIQLEGYADYWDDTRIPAGDDWFPQIKSAIENAKFAIFLVSAGSLSSRFIRDKEIPPLLERRAKEGLRLIPILIKHCPWKTVPWLSQIQMITDMGKPITGAGARTQCFSQVAGEIAERLHSSNDAKPASSGPREFKAVPPYNPGHEFFGRERELKILDDWAVSNKRALLFEAIGGMGKSMLTWEWAKHRASKIRTDWAGTFWYSFYEAGANMDAFCAHALAYVTGKDLGQFLGKKAAAMSDWLLDALETKTWLLVLDGAERLLMEYHRFDAAQVADEEVGHSNQCIVPADEDLLRRVCSEHKSKVLITSRMMPSALLNNSGDPRPGVQHVYLSGLDPSDAEGMLRAAEIRGDSGRMRAFLQKQFGCHPLVLGMVVGLVKEHFEAPGDFDDWSRRGKPNLAEMDRKLKRNHILTLAFERLSPQARALMVRIAIVPDSLRWEEMLALNPYLPEPPKHVDLPDSPESDRWLSYLREQSDKASSDEERARIEGDIEAENAELESRRQAYKDYRAKYDEWKRSSGAPERLKELCKDLRSRGLLQWETGSRRFDLHPVVRGFAVRWISKDERDQAGEKAADLFNSQEAPKYGDVRSLSELRQTLHAVRVFLQMESLDRAYEILEDESLADCLWYRLERHHEQLALLKPFFPGGWDQPAQGLEPDAIKWLANAASQGLYYSGQLEEALVAGAFALEAAIQSNGTVTSRLGDYIWRLMSAGRLREAEVMLRLELEIDEVAGDDRAADLDREAGYALGTGDLPRADRALKEWEAAGPTDSPGAGNASSLIRRTCRLRELQGTIADADWLEHEKTLSGLNERLSLRWFRSLWGQWLYRQKRWPEAQEKYGEAVRMAREVGLFEANDEARLAVCQARLANPEPARELLARQRTDIGDLLQAELYLSLGDKQKAREHAFARVHRVLGRRPALRRPVDAARLPPGAGRARRA